MNGKRTDASRSEFLKSAEWINAYTEEHADTAPTESAFARIKKANWLLLFIDEGMLDIAPAITLAASSRLRTALCFDGHSPAATR